MRALFVLLLATACVSAREHVPTTEEEFANHMEKVLQERGIRARRIVQRMKPDDVAAYREALLEATVAVNRLARAMQPIRDEARLPFEDAREKEIPKTGLPIEVRFKDNVIGHAAYGIFIAEQALRAAAGHPESWECLVANLHHTKAWRRNEEEDRAEQERMAKFRALRDKLDLDALAEPAVRFPKSPFDKPHALPFEPGRIGIYEAWLAGPDLKLPDHQSVLVPGKRLPIESRPDPRFSDEREKFVVILPNGESATFGTFQQHELMVGLARSGHRFEVEVVEVATWYRQPYYRVVAFLIINGSSEPSPALMATENSSVVL